MKSIVKVVWSGRNETPVLRVATEDGYKDIVLEPGLELDYEVMDERRCVGYHSERGKMESCTDFREIDSGDQCPECRRKDIYTGWRTGNGAPDGMEGEANYSVYLAQCGDHVKVGVARTSRLEKRWLEQGADYTSEIHSGLTAEDALEKEKELSGKGITERIRKEHKIKETDSQLLESKIEELGYNVETQKVSPKINCRKLTRTGRFPTPVKHVKGQIVSNGSVGLALTSGKVLGERVQRGLEEY